MVQKEKLPFQDHPNFHLAIPIFYFHICSALNEAFTFMMKLVFFFFITLLSLSVFSQKSGDKIMIEGTVKDSVTDQPMGYVTVSIHQIQDSALVTGAITDFEGHFIIKDLSIAGSFLLKYSFIGYQSRFFKLDGSKNMGEIKLRPDEEVLKTLEIVADKPPVTYEIDKKVVNVENMNTVASATAIEVLANIPSISVDMDGNVSLRGSQGFTLLIDGRPTAMEASEALRLIQASNIKDIEIITNPSAKYDAEGTSGIINIILKKNKLEGISTLINANAGTFNNYGANFLTSINKGKMKYNFGGQYSTANQYRTIGQERTTSVGENESSIISQGDHRFYRTNYGFNGAMEYTPNEDNVLSLSVNANERQFNAAANYVFDQYENDSLINAYENRERTLRSFFGLTVSGGYEHTIGKTKGHTLSLTGMYNLNNGTEDAQTEFYSLENVFQGGNRNTEVGPSQLLRFSLDYTRPLKKNGMKLMMGARTDIGNNVDDQDSYQYNFDVSDYERLALYSNDVSYLQNVYAGYGIFSGKMKEKLGYQFGLRAEYTDRFISLKNSTQSTSIERLDWFPSAHFSYELGKDNQLKANFSRRIERPRSWHLEPFVTWEDPYTVRQGNPDLLPEYIWSYELGWIKNMKKGSLSTELYYRSTTNIRERIQEVYDTNVIVKRPVNAGNSEALGLELAYNYKLKKWWSIDAGGNAFYYKIQGSLPGTSLNQESFSFRGRLSNTFSLPKDWKVQLIGNYESDVVNAQGITKGFYVCDLAIKKEFFERKLSTTLQFRNFLNSEVRESWVNTPTLYSYRIATPRYPEINFSVALRLNNFKNQDKIKTEEGDEF